MNRPTLLLLSLFALPAAAAGLPGAPQDGWAAYQVPMQPGTRAPCCWAIHGRGAEPQRCSLDDDHGITISDKTPRAVPGDALAVYVHYTGGAIDRVRSWGAACPVDAKQAPVALTGVAPERSVDVLAELANASPRKRLSEEAITALAFHGDEGATRTLANVAAGERPRQVRESAIFWLGQTRGEDGAAILERLARNDGDRHIREHAVFSLSQTDAIDGYAIIKDVAATDPSGHVRSQSLFWMAQTGDPRAKADILAAMDREQDAQTREQAVFALSQLKDGGEDALIDIVRGDYPRGIKKQALFWLGQSGSEEAIRFVDEVIGDAAAAK